MKNIREIILEKGSFERLNPMQEKMLESDSKRFALLAPTGSGKTAAFIIMMLRHLKPARKQVQALVVVPSRELAQQVAGELKKFAPEYHSLTLYGGHPLREELNSLQSVTPDILIATPGRLLDHLQRGTVNLSAVHILVIDEMDKCLDLGFRTDILKILKATPRPELFILTSATMPTEEDLLKRLGKLEIFDFNNTETTETPDIETIGITSFTKDKLPVLKTLLSNILPDGRTIVFLNHRESAQRVYDYLRNLSIPATLYHGALDQEQREISVITLRNGTTPVMVATDLAARGLDIPEVENVVHYHLPLSEETWTHRNGRTARAGRSGKVYVISSDEETVPDYIEFDRRWNPSEIEILPEVDQTTLIFNIGKKEKISRGDILGFLVKECGMEPSQIGRIDLGDHYSTVVVPKSLAPRLKEQLKGKKIKSRRFLIKIIGE